MPWRASCVETHTACSASGLGKRTDGNIDTAPQADSTVLEGPVMCRTRLSGKRTQRLIVLGKAGRFLSIPDHFGPFLVSTTDAHEVYFRADRAWFYIVLLSVGYMVSRGLAKAGTRHHDDA